MIKNYSVDTWDYIKEGCPPTQKEEYEKRIETCNSCPAITDTFKCSECGCPMLKKAKRQTAVCPLNKWPKTVIGEGGKKLALNKSDEKREENNNTTSNQA